MPAKGDPPEETTAIAAPASQRIGIAQFFTATDSRIRRRSERAYEVVKTLDPDQQPSARGYDLVFSGRLRRLDAGGVILCGTPTPDRAPDCILSADIDRVRLEQPGSAEVLAEWGS